MNPRPSNAARFPIGDIADQLGLELKRVTAPSARAECEAAIIWGAFRTALPSNTRAQCPLTVANAARAGDQLALVQLPSGVEFQISAGAHWPGERGKCIR